MPDDIERRVIDLIARRKKRDPSSITLDSNFEELGIDSLDGADLLFTLEDEFHLVIPDDAAQTMKSVREIVEGLRALVARPPTGAG